MTTTKKGVIWTSAFGALGLLVPALLLLRYWFFGTMFGESEVWLWPASIIFMGLEAPNTTKTLKNFKMLYPPATGLVPITHSLNAMTSYGHTNLELVDRWHLMGALEALNGWLLFGLTTAFLFAVIERVWMPRNK